MYIPAVSARAALPVLSDLAIRASGNPTCENLRSVISIVWSCLGTIFLCTWVAIHPNISVPRRGWVSNALHRLKILSVALIAPEFIIMWATRQFTAASRVAKRYRAHGWTRTHGFFFVMGGFHLYDGRTPLYPLTPNELDHLVQHGVVDFPDITKGEINDKGNSDPLAKALVVLQTTWFMVQCLARAIQGLPITDLEVVTVAFAALNVVVYMFWWKKPSGVDHPFRVLKKTPPTETNAIGDDPATPRDEGRNDPEAELLASLPTRSANVRCDWWTWLKGAVFYMLYGARDINGLQLSNQRKVPTFYDGDRDDGTFSGAARISVGMLFGFIFGGIHCAALAFDFPSWLEKTFWMASCFAIIASPFLMLALPMLVSCCTDEQHGFEPVVVAITTPFFMVYFFARLALIVIAFTSLRSLPHAALETIQWTNFIPHL